MSGPEKEKKKISMKKIMNRLTPNFWTKFKNRRSSRADSRLMFRVQSGLGVQGASRFEDQVSQRSIESAPSEIVDFSISAENENFEPRTFHEHVSVFFKDGVGNMDLGAKTPTDRFSSPQRRRRKRYFPMPHLLDDYYTTLVNPLLLRAGTWNYDTTMLDHASGGRCLPILCMHLFEVHGLMEFFSLSPESCWKLFVTIEESYNDSNHYHNSVHAADVTQAIHCFLLQENNTCSTLKGIFCPPPETLRIHMEPLEVLVALLAAITHDMDHPGVNIHFLLATEHPLTIIYKDQAQTAKEFQDNLPLIKKGAKRIEKLMIHLSNTNTAIREQGVGVCQRQEFKGDKDGPSKLRVGKNAIADPLPSMLEHHHWRTAYSCILQSKVFDHMKDELPKMRTMLKSLILSTDITRQNQYIEKFNGLVNKKKLNMNKAEHRHLVLQMALKTADISNPGRPWRISRAWSQKVCEEFYAQGDEERSRRIPITSLCDRHNDTMANIQTGFFTYVVLPLFRQWHQFVDDEISATMLGNLHNNQHNWEKILLDCTLDSFTASLVSSTFISSADLVTRNFESSTGSYYSVNKKGHSRRCSLSPVKPSKLREAFRRFSEPLGSFVSREPGSRARSARSKRDSIPEARLREEPSPVQVAGKLPKIVHEIVAVDQESKDGASSKAAPQEPAPLIDLSSPAPRQQFAISPVYDDDVGSFSGNSRGEGEEISFEPLPCALSISLKSSRSESLPSNVCYLRRLLSDSPMTNSQNGKASDFNFDIAWAGARIGNEAGAGAQAWETAGAGTPAWEMAVAKAKGRRGSAPASGTISPRVTLPASLSLHHGLASAARLKLSPYCHQLMKQPASYARRGSLPVEVMTGYAE